MQRRVRYDLQQESATLREKGWRKNSVNMRISYLQVGRQCYRTIVPNGTKKSEEAIANQ